MIVNRIGDLGLALGMFLLAYNYGSLDFTVIFSLSEYYNNITITAIGLLLFVGAVGKSAQLGLHT